MLTMLSNTQQDKKASLDLSIAKVLLNKWPTSRNAMLRKSRSKSLILHCERSEFLSTWSLRSNSVTRQVSFHRTKIGGKCDIWSNFQTICSNTFSLRFQKMELFLAKLKNAFYDRHNFNFFFSSSVSGGCAMSYPISVLVPRKPQWWKKTHTNSSELDWTLHVHYKPSLGSS